MGPKLTTSNSYCVQWCPLQNPQTPPTRSLPNFGPKPQSRPLSKPSQQPQKQSPLSLTWMSSQSEDVIAILNQHRHQGTINHKMQLHQITNWNNNPNNRLKPITLWDPSHHRCHTITAKNHFAGWGFPSSPKTTHPKTISTTHASIHPPTTNPTHANPAQTQKPKTNQNYFKIYHFIFSTRFLFEFWTIFHFLFWIWL